MGSVSSLSAKDLIFNPRADKPGNLRLERVSADRVPRPEELLGARSVAYVATKLGDLNWTWKVVGPHFVVAPSGVRFIGLLSISDGTSTILEPFERQAAATVQAGAITQNAPGAGALGLSVDTTPVPVMWKVAGRLVRIGMVNVGNYYSTSENIRVEL